MEVLAELYFVLLGDSGQKDPEIYTEIFDEFPERVLAIYIREVTGEKRRQVVEELGEKAARRGVDLVLANETVTLAEHAVSKGLIRRCELPAIRGQQEADREEAEV